MNIPIFNNLTRFAVRPMTVQRDELGRIMMWTVCASAFVSVPYEKGSRLCFVENDIAFSGYKNLAKRMVEHWEDHMSQYHANTILMRHIAEQAALSTTKQDMAKTYAAWDDVLKNFSDYFLAPFAVEQILDPQCRELLTIYYPDNVEDYFSIISTPDRMHEYQYMREKIFEAVLARDVTDSMCKQLAQTYGWYNEYSYIEPLLDAEYFKHEIKNISQETAKEEIKKIHQDIEQAKHAYNKFISQVKNPKLLLLAEILHTYTVLRTDRIDHFKQAQAHMRSFFDRVANYLNEETNNTWSRYEVVSLTNEEILAYLNNGVTPSYEEMKIRMSQQYIYYSEGGKPKFIYNQNEIASFVASITNPQKETHSVKGTVAFKGKVTGKVSIVKGKHDLDKVQLGDILIAPTTMPDYLPAMNKAIAFVTDEGGITSHAAIVARELKKPCIVGTKLATQIFKDGDMVEVDAVTGIIRKI